MMMTIFLTSIFQQFYQKDYSRINNETTSYISATVTEITNNQIQYDQQLKIYLGIQDVKVILKEGVHKGETVKLKNYLTSTHNVHLSQGDHIIVSQDEPLGVNPYYSVYNYDRMIPICFFILLLFSVIIIIGKEKGIKSILSLLYTLYLVVFLLLPTVFSGYSPVLMTIVTIVLSTIVTLLLLNGESRKTYSAILSTIIGVLLSGLCFIMMSYALHLNGFSSEEAESLILINQATHLSIKDILFVGILISSLGAIMDVGMSIVSSLYEIHHHKPDLKRKELYRSGIEIGKDMIGTMTNTLILAFTGSAFISLLVLFSFHVDMKQLLNSNYLMIEFIQGIAGTLGIVLTVPLSSFISSYFLTK